MSKNERAFSFPGNPLLCDCRLLWILRDLRISSLSASVKTGIDRLNCTGHANGSSSTNLITTLSVLECRPSTVRPATTRRPSRGSTTSTHVEEKPKLPIMVNDSSASLQLSSPVESKEARSQEPISSAATNTVLPELESSAPIIGFHIVTICLSLIFTFIVVLL